MGINAGLARRLREAAQPWPDEEDLRATLYREAADAIDRIGEWRSISTAPKDGTVILCFAPDSDAQQRWLIMWTEWEDGSGNWTDAHTLDSFDVEPTHWMPLPERPITSSEAA